MLKQIKSFLGRPAPQPRHHLSPTCTHPYCAHRPQCLKSLGEQSLSQSSLISFSSENHTLNTLISDHFSGHGVSIDIDYSWDSEEGWAVVCHRCHQERCQDCEERVFEQITGFEDVLTFESREVWICSPCRHLKCPGMKLKILSLCAGCGHGACAECMVDGDEIRGVTCCLCFGEKTKLNVQTELPPKRTVTEEDQIAENTSETNILT